MDNYQKGEKQLDPIQIKPNKIWKKIVLIVVICLVVVGIGFYFLPQILSIIDPNDDPLVDQSNLLLKPNIVPDAENGFYDLDKITDELFYLPLDYEQRLLEAVIYKDLPPWDPVFVEDILSNNQEVLEYFNQASNKESIQNPDYVIVENLDYDTELYPLNNWRKVARLQALKSQYLSRQGKPDEALIEAAKLNKIGHKIINSNNNFIGVLVGISIEKLGTETILQILQFGNPGKQALAEVYKTIGISNNNLEGYKNGFRFEYTSIANTVDKTLNSPLEERFYALSGDPLSGGLTWGEQYPDHYKHSYYYKPNQTKNLYANLYLTHINAIGERCELDDLEGELLAAESDLFYRNKIKLLFTENALGKMFFSITGLSFGQTLSQICYSELLSKIARIELAMRAYKMDFGVLPNTLSDLVPFYLNKSIPIDPFDKQPLRYSAEKQILYSVGPGKLDVGGSTGDDWALMENPTFRIEF